MLLSGTVTSKTKVTAKPSPIAVSTFLETAKKEHMPKKKASAMFSTNIDLRKMLKSSILLLLLVQLRAYRSLNPNDESNQEKGTRCKDH